MRYALVILLFWVSASASADHKYKPQSDADVYLNVFSLESNLNCVVVVSKLPEHVEDYRTRFILPEGAFLLENDGSCDSFQQDQTGSVLSVEMIRTDESLVQIQVIVSWDIGGQTFRNAVTWPEQPKVLMRSLDLTTGSRTESAAGLHIIKIGDPP